MWCEVGVQLYFLVYGYLVGEYDCLNIKSLNSEQGISVHLFRHLICFNDVL